jgi:hypothetical protein
MQFGDCPYCKHSDCWETPDTTPAWRLWTCEECGKAFWLELSRVDPKAWTVEDFGAQYVIDHEARTLIRREAA